MSTPLLRTLAVLALLVSWTAAQDAGAAAPHMQAGMAKLNANDAKGALADFEKAVAASPEYGPGYQFRGWCKHMMGDHEAALVDIDKAIELDGAKRGAYTSRAQVKRAMHDYDGALADLTTSYDAFKRNPMQALQILFQRASLRDLMHDLDGALEDYDTLMTFQAENAQLYLARANTKFAKGDADGAAEDLELAMYCDENNPDVWMTKGRIAMRQGKLDEAKECFGKAGDIAPTSPRMLFDRGRFRVDIGMYKEAAEDLAKAVAAGDAGQEYAWLYLCLAYGLAGDAAKGKEVLKGYLEGRAEKDDWFVKVASYLTGGLPEEEFLAAAKSDNKHMTREHECEAYWYAGCTRLIAGHKAKAKEYFEKVRSTKVHVFIEYESAGQMLKRLG